MSPVMSLNNGVFHILAAILIRHFDPNLLSPVLSLNNGVFHTLAAILIRHFDPLKVISEPTNILFLIQHIKIMLAKYVGQIKIGPKYVRTILLY